MVQWHTDIHKRKSTGGKRTPYRKKRRYECGGEPVLTIVGDRKIKTKDTFGGGVKVALVSEKVANVYNPATKRVEKTAIVRVKSNPSNKDYERRGILTKGAIIETPLGDARVTSRPGRDGVINAVLIVPTS
ncbi:MAG: 30S ribosomal protein S8e [Nitrososphaerota archaeon]